MTMNLNQILNLIKSGYNPQQIVLNMMENNMRGTPLGDNLIQLAKQGNTAEIEKIARNIVTQRGGDFDKDFSTFKQQLGIF